MGIRFYHALYNFTVVPFLRLALFVGKLFSSKIAEREAEASNTLKVLATLADDGRQRIWVHAASMGEFEQAKPVIEGIKEQKPDILVVVSFFSPSGYRNQRSYPFADAVVYLPFDTRKNATAFLKVLHPNLAVFVRYDTWWNYLYALRSNGIPSYLINATFPSSSLSRLFPMRGFLRALFSLFSTILTNGNTHAESFRRHTQNPAVSSATDTRYDRITQAVKRAQSAPILAPSLFKPTDIVIVAGSSWQADEEALHKALQLLGHEAENLRYVIVPHEPTEEALQRIEHTFGDIQRLSGVGTLLTSRHIVVDSIGKLLGLYASADAAYIGGGYGAGVHSVSEAAGYGIPTACGPAIERNDDAKLLLSLGGLHVLRNSTDVAEWIRDTVLSPQNRAAAGRINARFLEERSGTTDIVVSKLMQELQKT